MNRFSELERISRMERRQRIEIFFGAYFDLIERGIRENPVRVRPYARIWIKSVSGLMRSDSVCNALDLSLDTYAGRGARQHAVVVILDKELIAALAQMLDILERMEAAEKPDADVPEDHLEEGDAPKKWSVRRLFGDWWRGGEAAHSLVGSWSEVLKDVLPDWLKGGLKVAQEGWEIYGRTRRPKN